MRNYGKDCQRRTQRRARRGVDTHPTGPVYSETDTPGLLFYGRTDFKITKPKTASLLSFKLPHTVLIEHHFPCHGIESNLSCSPFTLYGTGARIRMLFFSFFTWRLKFVCHTFSFPFPQKNTALHISQDSISQNKKGAWIINNAYSPCTFCYY